MTDFIGTVGNDRLIGGDDNDGFFIEQGGADIVKGDGGDDEIHAGGGFSADDKINGGSGNDVLILDGDYSAGVVFGARTLVGVERLEVATGNDYDLTLSDRSAASSTNPDGKILAISGNDMGVDDHVRIDASALLAGHQLNLSLTGQATADVIGGAGDDTVVFADGGRYDFSGGDGHDTVALYRTITQADHFDGGGGDDALVMLAGQDVALSGAMLESVETLWVTAGDYAIEMRDTAVAAGDLMYIYGGDLEAGQHLAFDGARERDGVFQITGGADSDTLTGGRGGDGIAAGSGDDLITGGGGADVLTGGDGADTFVYRALGDGGTHGQFDLITDLEDVDVIDLSALDAKADKAGDQAFHLVTAFSGHAGQLVMTYDADSDLTSLTVDVNGDAKADMTVQIAGDHHDFAGFVL